LQPVSAIIASIAMLMTSNPVALINQKGTSNCCFVCVGGVGALRMGEV
jgi:hypothetical protein